MISLHPSHLTHSPSGTVLRGRSWRTGLGFLVLRNQAMVSRESDLRETGKGGTAAEPRAGNGNRSPQGPASSPFAALPEIRSGFGALPLFGFEVVGDAEAHAGRVIHLARGLLGVLELGEAVFHLGKLLFDQAVELFHPLPGHGEGVLVELSLLIGEAHRLLFLRLRA